MLSRNDFQKFYEIVSKIFKAVASKLFEKVHWIHSSCALPEFFNPTLIHAENKLSLMKIMKSLTQQLHILGIISAYIGDNPHEQYEDLVKSNFNSISYKDGDHLDDLFFETLKIEQFPELAQILIIIFAISHCQADVERPG